jgi:hypothetical protein
MRFQRSSFLVAVAAAAMLVACSGGNKGSNTTTTTTTTTTQSSPGASPAASPAAGAAASPAASPLASPVASPAASAVASPSNGAMMGARGTPAPIPGSLHCGAQGPVWVNTRSHVYHVASDPMYGRTVHGKYMCLRAAVNAGNRAAGQHAGAGAQASPSP